MENFSQGYKHYGFNRGAHEGKTGIWYREWAPDAKVRRHAARRTRRGAAQPARAAHRAPCAALLRCAPALSAPWPPAPCPAGAGRGGPVQQLGPQG
jgi:hypothetical protein